MAPTRGFRRAIIAVAATIIAARFSRFSVFQRSAPKPAPPVRTVTGVTRLTPLVTPTARAPPVHNTTAAPPPPKRRKVAVFYNVYAPPRPHNRTCTSSKTWHKDGEPDKNCAWIGSSNNKQVTARRCRTASRVAAEVCGCECANVTTDLESPAGGLQDPSRAGAAISSRSPVLQVRNYRWEFLRHQRTLRTGRGPF